MLECTTVTGSVDGNTFYTFVHSKLLPQLMPRNTHSVVTMDSASIHHVDGIIDIFTSVAVLAELEEILNPLSLSILAPQHLSQQPCFLYNQ